MPVLLLKDVNFGQARANLTGSLGVSYQVLDKNGNVVIGPTTSGVIQTAPGIYVADVSFPDSFNGQILWTCPATGSLAQAYASEQYNVQENDPKVADTWQMVNSVTGSIQALYNLEYGRWQIVGNQMLFYGPDNSTLLVTFNLFDENGNPTMDSVFQRVKV